MPAGFAHLTLATRDVDRTASFLERAFGLTRAEPPANSPVPTVWLELAGGQQIHIVHVDGFASSPFEGEFGRHVALYYPPADFDALRARLAADAVDVADPLRPSAVRRFFLRDPVNGYVIEVIAR